MQPDLSLEAVIPLVAPCLFGLVSGFNDGGNLLASFTSGRVIAPPMAAVLLLFCLAGPLVIGTAVARTIGTNVIDLRGQGELGYVLIVLSPLTVVLMSWRFGIPTSMTLALVGGMLGWVLASGGRSAVHWAGVARVLVGMPVSVLGGGLLALALYWAIRRFLGTHAHAAMLQIARLQLLTAAVQAFAYGANDMEKSVGLIAVGMSFSNQHQQVAFSRPLPIIGAFGFFYVGALVGGWRVASRIGFGVLKVRPMQALAQQFASGTVVGRARRGRRAGEHDADDRWWIGRRRRGAARLFGAVGNRPRAPVQLAADAAAGGRGGGGSSLCCQAFWDGTLSIGRTIKALGRSNDRRFVQLLSEQADLTIRALQALEKFGRQPTANDEFIEEIKEIEREGDAKRRILIDELAHTYATPFDREDLFALSRAIDDILDAANETAIELSIYKIAPPEGLHEMAVVLVEGARHIRASVGELLDHPGVASEHAVRAKRSENRIDSLYHQAVGSLFDSGDEISHILKSREIYRHIKNSADRIDRAADDISVIVIKRS
jgi:predicted phosphate transport protein (TIGR00153 family)